MTLLFAAIITIACSWLAVGRLIHYLTRKDIVDRPNERSMHTGVVPRGGGLVTVALILLALLLLSWFSSRPTLFIGLAVCLFAWAALSWADDKFDLSAGLRFAVQTLLSVLTVCLFGWVGSVASIQLGWFGPLLCIIGIVWMANLNNFMDGMDGLAASQAIIASVTLGSWFYFLGDFELALLCCVIAAAHYGFLMWNWHPAKVFMGDVGSISIGALFATLLIIANNRHDIPAVSSLMVFAVFVADASYTVLSRAVRGEKIWLPHRSHFYQRAGLAGLAHDKIVVIAIMLMILCSLLATLSVLYRDTIGLITVCVLTILVASAYGVIRLERKAN